MLVLTRRKEESIVINGDVTITVLEVDRSGQVKLGITAPKAYRILRSELLREVADENRSAQVDSAVVLPQIVVPTVRIS